MIRILGTIFGGIAGVLGILGIIILVLYYILKIADKNKEEDDAIDSLLKKIKVAIPILLVVSVLGLLSGSFYSVSENEQAVVTMFGKVQSTEGAGVHFKIPYLQKVKIVDMSTHGSSIGYYTESENQKYGANENPQMITSDFNLINVDFYLEYKINDLVAYLYNSEEPERILNDIAMSAIRTVISDYTVDDVMTVGKSQIQQKIKEMLMRELEKQNIGLQIVNILIQDVEPPTEEVMNAFKAVETAKQGADTIINNAKKYQSEELPKAEAEADKIIQQAEAKKQSRIAEAEGQVSRFEKMYEEYRKYPLITKKRIFYETMEELLPEMEIIITDGNSQTYIPLEGMMGGN